MSFLGDGMIRYGVNADVEVNPGWERLWAVETQH